MSLCMALRRQCVVICDRGLMDGKAYCTPEVWEQVKERMDMTEESMMARCLCLSVRVCGCVWRSRCIPHDACPSLPITCAAERRPLASDMLCLV